MNDTTSKQPRNQPVVAIDGPAGAGKSTVAARVAERLGFVRVDTGALYRGLALAGREAGVAWADGPAMGALADGLALTFVNDAHGDPRLHIDGVDRAGDIRSPEISQGASKVSAHPEVRAALLALQRRLGADGGVVLEGRDIGTVVFPDAEVKVFLTASVGERASRRQKQLSAQGIETDLAEQAEEIRVRDHRDSSRPVAPLKPAEDSVIVDSSEMTLEQVVERIVGLVLPQPDE